VTCRPTLIGLLLAALSFSQTPTQRPRLPQCHKGPTSDWDNCLGTITYANRDKYVGEFLNGKRSGQGTYTFSNGEKYVGEYRDGNPNGRGTSAFPNGDKYVGEFRDGKRNGQGNLTLSTGETYVGEFFDGQLNGQVTATYPTGDEYVGEFRDGKRHGQGTFTFSNGRTYFGEFLDGKPNGQGIYTFPNGNKHVGEFRDGKPNGPGTFTHADGTQEVGQFRNGDYIGPSTSFEVLLHKENGVLLVPVLINDKIPLDFVLDSGAADVSIPADVVLTLIRTGTLTEADFMGTNTYVLADGSKVPSQTFRIRSLKVGDQTLQNVVGSVASVNGSLLLGQSFLTRFKSWSIDNARQVLVLR